MDRDFILEPWGDDEEVPSYEEIGEMLEEEGCLFPNDCVMPGYHLKAECATADMMRAMLEDEGEA